MDLNDFGSFVGLAKARGVLYQVSPNYPGMVDGSGDVPGELWLLNDPPAALAFLDRYEGEEYHRVLRQVFVGTAEVEAWVYLYNREPVGERLVL